MAFSSTHVRLCIWTSYWKDWMLIRTPYFEYCILSIPYLNVLFGGIPYFEYCILFFVGRGETCDVVPVHKFEITSYYFNYFYYFLLYGCIISTSHLFGSLSYFRWTSVFCFFYAIAYMDSWDPSHVQKMVITLHIYVVFSTPYKNKNLDDIFICTVFFSGETKKWDLETFVYMVFLVDILLSVFFVLCMISWEFFFVFRGERRIFSTVFSVP
jgi:hypothetical protein